MASTRRLYVRLARCRSWGAVRAAVPRGRRRGVRQAPLSTTPEHLFPRAQRPVKT